MRTSEDAGLIAGVLRTLPVTEPGYLVTVRAKGSLRVRGPGLAIPPVPRGPIWPGGGGQLSYQGVLRRQHQVSGTRQRVRPRSERVDHRAGPPRHLEVDTGAIAGTDPVPLHGLDRL